MLRIPWTARRSNDSVLGKVNERRSLITNIRKRQSMFFGHIMRRGKLEHIVTTGKISGKRDRGRQREKILDSLTTYHGKTSTSELINITKGRCGKAYCWHTGRPTKAYFSILKKAVKND